MRNVCWSRVCLSDHRRIPTLLHGPRCKLLQCFCPLLVHYWVDLHSVHGFRCCGNIAQVRNVSECLYSLYAWLYKWAFWLIDRMFPFSSLTILVRWQEGHLVCESLCHLSWKVLFHSVSTTPRNTGNLLEFLIPPGNTGNILEFHWSSWKFLTDGTTTKTSSHKQILLQSSCLENGDDYVYFSWWLRLLGKQDCWS